MAILKEHSEANEEPSKTFAVEDEAMECTATEQSNQETSKAESTHVSTGSYTKSEEVTEDPNALAYLNHLLSDGSCKGDSGTPLELPPWYNDELFKKGQTCIQKYRFVMKCGMLYGLVAVLAIPSILRVLMATRQSSTCVTAFRRYVRTIFHTDSWYEYSPTEKASKFWTSLRAVRKAHAKSSSACSKLGAGQITQKDMALTQFGFIGFITLGAPRIQLYDIDFLESTSHMWRVLGYLLGIKDEYNICGQNWEETKSRLDIVMRKVFEPALENVGEDFERMTKTMIDGLWAMNSTLSIGSVLFLTKRLCYVKGYEFFKFDHRPGRTIDPNQRSYYNDLGLWDRFLVSYGLFLVTYLHKYNIVRWYLNIRLWISMKVTYYFPYLAFWKYGFKNAYVRIFTKDGRSNDFEFHLKAE